MTTKKIFIAGCSVLSALLLIVGCTKKPVDKITKEQSDFSSSAQLQLFNLIVPSTGNFIAVDGKTLNGNALSLGGSFPAVGYSSSNPSSGNSFVVSAGLHNFQLRDSAVATKQPLLSFAETFEGNKNYTVFAYDSVTSPKQKIVTTAIVIPTDNTARVRFANFIYSPGTVPAIDIFSKKQNANVATGLQKTDVTDFISYPSIVSDTLIVRATGTTTALAQLNGFIPIYKKSYTVVFRGSYNMTAGTPARTLSAFVNH